MQFYIFVMLLGLPDDIHEEKPSFLQLKKKRITDGRTDGPTDGPTDRRTDGPSYRDARTHLKIIFMADRYNFMGSIVADELGLGRYTAKGTMI